MAAWGPGPFENDAGLAYLSAVTRGLVERIRIASETQAEGDDLDEAVAAMQVLITLVRKKHPVVLPTPQEISSWQEPLLGALDEDRARRRAAKRDADALLKAAQKLVEAGEDTLLPVGRLSGLVARTARRKSHSELVDAVALGNWIDEKGDALDSVWDEIPRGDWLLVVASAAGLPDHLMVSAVAEWVRPVTEGEGDALSTALDAATAWAADPNVDTAAACGAARHHAAQYARGFEGRGSEQRHAIASAATAVADAADAAAAGEVHLSLQRLVFAILEVARLAELQAVKGEREEAVIANLASAADALRAGIDWSEVQSAYAQSLGHESDTERVIHPKFGEGLIVREIPGRVTKLEVDFGARGRKILAKAFFERLIP